MSDLGPSCVRKLPAQGELSQVLRASSSPGRSGSAGWRRARRLGGAEEGEGNTSLVRITLRCVGLEPCWASGSFRLLRACGLLALRAPESS